MDLIVGCRMPGWECSVCGKMVGALRAVDFRCFSALSVEVPEAGALLTGHNAQGKTSILEAVCLLVRLHSPRSHRMATLARVGGAGGFGVAGEAWGMERRMKWEPRRPVGYKVDGEDRSSQGDYLADGGLLVWMGNEDVELIRGGGEGRRRYLDFIGSQVDLDYRRSLHRYRRALKAKNFLLKEGSLRDAEILSYEGVMIEAAAVIQPVRERLMKLLSPAAASCQIQIAGRDELLELEYHPAGGGHFPEALEQARDRERRQRRSLVGPHRDEIIIKVNGLDASDFASEGQQRTVALALKLAQGKVLAEARGESPIWLIDDVFGELDVARRNALMEALPTGAQKWITTTHLDWLDASSGLGGLARFSVSEGSVN